MSAQIGGINGGYQNSFTVVVWKSAGSGQKGTRGHCNGARIGCGLVVWLVVLIVVQFVVWVLVFGSGYG